MMVEDIVSAVQYEWVVITGGEPTLYDLDALILALRDNGNGIQLETSGQNALKGSFVPDWVTISPKERLAFKVPDELLRWASELKFVVDEGLAIETVIELERRLSIVKKYRPGEPDPEVVLMPEGCPPRPEMVQKALGWLEMYNDWYYGDRLQYRLGLP